MKVEMLRSRLYNGQTLERGRVVDVDDTFGRWMVSRGMAAPYAKPSFLEDVFQEPEKKRGRPRKGD